MCLAVVGCWMFVSILNSNRRELSWMKVLWVRCIRWLGLLQASRCWFINLLIQILFILCMNLKELNEYCSTACFVLSRFIVIRSSAATLFSIWQILGEREGIGILQSTLGAWAADAASEADNVLKSCLSDDPWRPLRHVFLSARNGQGFPTMQVRLLLQSGTMSFSVRQSLPMVCGSDDLSDVFSRSKPRAAMISEEARKKQQRDAGILSDSIGFYRILSDSMIFPSYLEVFGWSAAGLFESWSRLSPAVALLGRSLHPDLRGQACGRTPWRCLAPAVVVWLKWLGYDLATAQKMGWMAHWSNYWWNFSPQNGGQWAMPLCHAIPICH